MLSQTITSVWHYTCYVSLALKLTSGSGNVSASSKSGAGPVLKDITSADILLLPKYITAAGPRGRLEQTETVMGEKTDDEPQNLLMNLCTQQILLI